MTATTTLPITNTYCIYIHIYIITNDASLSRLPPPYIPLFPSYLYTPYNAFSLCPLHTCLIQSLDSRPGAPKSIRSHFLLDQFLGDAVISIGSLVYVCMYVCTYVCMYVCKVRNPSDEHLKKLCDDIFRCLQPRFTYF